MEDMCCVGLVGIGLLTGFVFMILPGPTYPNSSGMTPDGCLGWHGLCTNDLPSKESATRQERLEWKIQGDTYNGWRMEALSDAKEDFLITLDPIDSTNYSNGYRLRGQLRPPGWYEGFDWKDKQVNTSGTSTQAITAEVMQESGAVRLLLSHRLPYLKRYTQGKKTVSKLHYRDEVVVYRREPVAWYTVGPDPQVFIAFAILFVFCAQTGAGLLMLARLKSRMSSTKVNPVDDENGKTLHTNEPAKMPTNEPSNEPTNENDSNAPTNETDAPKKETSVSMFRNVMEQRREKVKARGYDTHLMSWLQPLLPLVLLLGGTLSMQREHHHWGVRSCPDMIAGDCGNLVLAALLVHCGIVAASVFYEWFGGGQSHFASIASSAEEFEDHMQNLLQGRVSLTLHGRAWHTTSSGSGKNRRTTTHTTFNETRAVKFSNSKDCSQIVDSEMLRRHPLVCVTCSLHWRAASDEVQAALDAQEAEFRELAQSKDSCSSCELSCSLGGWPADGLLSVGNGSQHNILTLAFILPVADFFLCGWAIRIMMEFYTVHTNIMIIKEVS